MRKLIKLEKKLNILFDNDIYEYLNPDYVYLPIYDGFELLKKQDDKVLINEIVVENKLNKIKSPISGVIKGTTFLNIYNKKTKCVVIENTYEEKEKINNKNVTLTRANIISTLSENNYLSFAKILENKNIKNLIINGMEDEPYIQNNPFILKKYANKLLKLIDDFVNIFQIDNAFISIKSNDTDNINLFLSKIGTYPKINLSLINDYYLLAQDYFLLENMNLSNEDSLVISASDLYKIYNIADIISLQEEQNKDELGKYYKEPQTKPTYETEAESLQADGLLKGNENGLDLLKPLTRIEATAILVRAMGYEDAQTSGTSYFADIQSDNWGAKYANIAKDKGIATGVGDDKFAPNDAITASQFATLILRNMGESPDWQTAINTFVERGLITSEQAEKMDLFTRGDMAKIIFEAKQKNMF